MQAYLLDNEKVLALDDDVFGTVQIIDAEVPLEQGQKVKGTDGRIDILASYSEEYIAIVELKLELLDRKALIQLEGYLAERRQLLSRPNVQNTEDSVPEPKWIGILVGSDIDAALAELLRNGYQTREGIPVAALTMHRFRGSDGTIIVTTDSYFKSLAGKDLTKYLFEGQIYGKGRLALAVVKRYVEANPATTFAQLQSVFPKSVQGSRGVIASADEANHIYAMSGRRRHFLEPSDLIQLRDGVAAVSSQWGIGNIDRFLRKSAQLGFLVQSAS